MIGFEWGKNPSLTSIIKSNFASFVNNFINANLLSVKPLLQRLDEQTLAGCNLLTDPNQFQKKRIRINTKLK
jgi:hypothetical protein